MNKYDFLDYAYFEVRRERLKYLAVCYLTEKNLKLWHEEELWYDEICADETEAYSYLREAYLTMLYEQGENGCS